MSTIPANDALARLREGNQRFVKAIDATSAVSGTCHEQTSAQMFTAWPPSTR